MLSAAQITQFEKDGVVSVPELLCPEQVGKVRVLLWQYFEKGLVLRDQPDSWPRGMVSKLRAISERASVQGLVNDDVMTIIGQLMKGRGTATFTKFPVQLLVTFPDADQWSVPSKMWHLDIPRLPNEPRLPGVQPFIFLDEVAPGGGGTVVVTGSHKLLNETGARIPSGQIKTNLADRYDWFARLMDKSETDRQQFMQTTGQADNVSVQVRELTGQPGDIVFMDMRLLHAPAPNTAKQPRMMATARYIDQALLPEIYGAD